MQTQAHVRFTEDQGLWSLALWEFFKVIFYNLELSSQFFFFNIFIGV